MKDLQTDASQHIAAIARWDNEGGACNVLSKKTDAELKKRPRGRFSNQQDCQAHIRQEQTDIDAYHQGAAHNN
jgi:hypothetical protein